MDEWVAKKVSRKSSRYYSVLAAVQAQLDGFIAGYTTAAAQGRRFPTLARKDFTLLNGIGTKKLLNDSPVILFLLANLFEKKVCWIL